MTADASGASASSSNDGGVAAGAVLTNSSLYARVAAFQCGFPFAVKQLVDSSSSGEVRAARGRKFGPIRLDGILPRLAIADGDTQTLRLLFDLKTQPQHALDAKLSFVGAMGYAVKMTTTFSPASWTVTIRLSVLDCVAELTAHDPTWYRDSDVFMSVFYSPSVDVEVLEWIYEHLPEDKRVLRSSYMTMYASRGDLEVVQWLHSHGCSASAEAADLAACASRTQVLEFLYQNTSVRCSPKGVEKAVAKAELETIKLILSQESETATQARVINAAARHGRLDVVQYVVESGITTHSPAVFAEAVRAGQLSVVQYLHEHHLASECSWRTMDSAAFYGHVDVVRFLHEHRSEGCTPNAMNGAAANGHLEVVRFLHEHRTEGCSVRAMDGAAEFGRLEMLRFLHEHRSEGCSSHALKMAAANGHVDVIAFLCEHRAEGDVRDAIVTAARNGKVAAVKLLYNKSPEARESAFVVLRAAESYGRRDVIQFLCEQQQIQREGSSSPSFLMQAVKGESMLLVNALLPFVSMAELEQVSASAFVREGHPRVREALEKRIDELRQLQASATSED